LKKHTEHFKENLSLVLATDASQIYPEGKEKPIAFASKTEFTKFDAAELRRRSFQSYLG